METIRLAQVGELVVQIGEGSGIEWPIHAHGEQSLEPAAGVVVAVEMGDLHHRFLRTGDQLEQVHVTGQDIAVFFQLLAHEVQRILPVAAFRHVEQDHRHDRTLAGLDQRQHLERLVQGTEATWAEHQGIGFLDEEQLAQEEEVERDQVAGIVHHVVGALLEGQGNVQAQAVFQSGAFVGGGHDAAAGAGHRHQFMMGQQLAEVAGLQVQRVVRCGAR
ncbi:hypothetical protein D3C80_775310 [compost metagenome]